MVESDISVISINTSSISDISIISSISRYMQKFRFYITIDSILESISIFCPHFRYLTCNIKYLFIYFTAFYRYCPQSTSLVFCVLFIICILYFSALRERKCSCQSAMNSFGFHIYLDH